jgi:hypothetical protein
MEFQEIREDIANLKKDVQVLGLRVNEILAILKPKPKGVAGRFQNAKTVEELAHERNLHCAKSFYEDYELQKGNINNTVVFKKKSQE